MKKSALFAILLTLSSLSLGNAQLKHFGVKVGATSADLAYHLEGSEDLPTVRRVGFCLAAFAEWFEHSPVSLLTQVEYVQKGAGMDVLYTNAGGDLSEPKTEYTRLDYLSIPLLGKLSIPTGSFSPYVLAGPRVDFLLGYANETGGFDPVYDQFEKTLFGATVGAGIQTEALLPLPVALEARYNLDITNSYERGIIKVHNTSFDLWLAVAF